MSSALVLIHGYPFDHTLWDKMAPKLPQQVMVLTPDLPGFGITPVLSSEPSLDAMADWVAAQMDAQKIQRAVIAGMSMGGYVALAFAERHSTRLAGLGLISTQAAADTEEARAARREMIGKVRREGAQVAAAAAVPKLFAAANQSNQAFTDYAVEGAAKAGVAGICWALEAIARRPDRTHIATKGTVPTLVLHGVEDKFISVDKARQLASQIPNAKYVEVPNAGHATPIEAPDVCASALQDLVQRAQL